MLQRLIAASLAAPRAVVVLFVALLAVGAFVVPALPVDVFPDLSAPAVTVLTEATVWAPEEVELFVTLPIESAVNGASAEPASDQPVDADDTTPFDVPAFLRRQQA